MELLSFSHAHENGHEAAIKTSTSFGSIAAEIYLKVVEHLHTARDIASLARTCRKVRHIIDRDGWRIFAQIHFPTIVKELPPGLEDWKGLARSLTVQSCAWDKRAFSTTSLIVNSHRINQLVDAFGSNLHLEEKISQKANIPSLLRWDKSSQKLSQFRVAGRLPVNEPTEAQSPPSSRNQTTPFHPVIDTKLEFSGSYSSKRQTVVWSTGPEILVRVCRSGSFLPSPEDAKGGDEFLDPYSNKLDFFAIQHGDFRSGVDDVTFLNIMSPSPHLIEPSSDNVALDIVAGRASGLLHRYSISKAGTLRAVVNTFHSFENQGVPSRRYIRSGDANSKTDASLLVACSDKVISLYETEGEDHDKWPIIELEIELDLPRAQLWTSKFSSKENLLLGLGNSIWPLHCYKATSTGLVLTEKLGIKCDTSDSLGLVNSSVYAIEPLSGVSRAAGSDNGDVFLTGSYDGVCRLYDRRQGSSPVQSIYDPIDTESAVYSLTSFGHERFLTGSANSRLKIFDFRSSSKAYYYTDALGCSEFGRNPTRFWDSTDGRRWINRTPAEACHHDFRTGTRRVCRFHALSRLEIYRRNTTIFLYGAPPTRQNHNRAGSHQQISPVFSLSSPDPFCPIVYAGTTGTVYELEVSEIDQAGNLLDPYFAAPPGAGALKDVQQLAMYEMDQVGDDPSPPVVGPFWKQVKGPRTRDLTPISARERLDTRWRSLRW